MNSFDFSLYDNSDLQPRKQSITSSKTSVPESSNFDFSDYDFSDFTTSNKPINIEEQSALQDRIYQRYAPKEKTPQELKNMSVSERMQYLEDLKTSREYLQSAGFTKNVLSVATLGASENIDLLKPQPHELHQELGAFVGAILPLTGAAKLASIPTKAAFKNAPSLLKKLQYPIQAFGTGAIYESGKQGINALSGNEVDLTQIPIRGAEFATLDAFLRGGSALAQKFLKISPANQAQILEQGIIPEDLPKSQYETAEEMLNLIRSQRQQPGRPPGGGPPPPPPPAAPINPNRVRAGGEDLGLRPAHQRATPNLQDEIGNMFSQNRFYNTTQGGHAFRNEIMNIDEDVYRGVNALYNRSRELNSQVIEIHPQLVNRLQTRIAEIRAIPEPSDIERRLLRASNNIMNELAEFENVVDEAGNVIGREITGYTPINNQTLIDQIQSLRKIIDYDFAHGNAKNIFRPLINELQDSALRAAETSTTPEAAEAINQASAGYRQWVEAFDNDYVRPFRDASNQDYSKLFKSALDFDESNMLRRILSTTPRGRELADASVREIVDKNLSKFFDNPRGANPREFDKAVRELEAVISPEQAQEIRTRFREASRRTDIRARQQPQRQPTNDERIASKYLDKKPEDVQSMMNSRSGIRELREDFSSTPQKQQIFDRLSKQKMRSILREGNIEKDFTGNDLYKFLNKEKNYEIFSEIIGEAEVENLRLAAKQIGKDQVKQEARKKGLQGALNKAAIYKTIDLIISII